MKLHVLAIFYHKEEERMNCQQSWPTPTVQRCPSNVGGEVVKCTPGSPFHGPLLFHFLRSVTVWSNPAPGHFILRTTCITSAPPSYAPPPPHLFTFTPPHVALPSVYQVYKVHFTISFFLFFDARHQRCPKRQNRRNAKLRLVGWEPTITMEPFAKKVYT